MVQISNIKEFKRFFLNKDCPGKDMHGEPSQSKAFTCAYIYK